MAIKFGVDNIKKIYYGDTEIKKVYFRDKLIYQNLVPLKPGDEVWHGSQYTEIGKYITINLPKVASDWSNVNGKVRINYQPAGAYANYDSTVKDLLTEKTIKDSYNADLFSIKRSSNSLMIKGTQMFPITRIEIV